ncbi:protein of unknown function [Paraburkholderia kururiensis]
MTGPVRVAFRHAGSLASGWAFDAVKRGRAIVRSPAGRAGSWES